VQRCEWVNVLIEVTFWRGLGLWWGLGPLWGLYQASTWGVSAGWNPGFWGDFGDILAWSSFPKGGKLLESGEG